MHDLFMFLQLMLAEPIYYGVTNSTNVLFSWGSRQSLFFISLSYLIAFGLFYYHKQRHKHPQSYWNYIGGKKVFLHPSAKIDYLHFLYRSALYAIFVTPYISFFKAYIPDDETVTVFLNSALGTMASIHEHWLIIIVYSVGSLLIGDFKHYWVHRLFHTSFLWEFHKVHHAAEVLIPLTAARVHVFEKFIEKLAALILYGLYGGIFDYLSGGQVSLFVLYGISFSALFFNSLASNLRHTHIWLSFGHKIEHIINSPAQHQIHHSKDPKHYNKNFGTNLSIWDWMFGTLYTTSAEQEKLEFGIEGHDNQGYNTIYGITLKPFVVSYKNLVKVLNKQTNETR